MQNPFFRATTNTGVKVDINLNAVATFEPAVNSDGTLITLINGSTFTIDLSPAAVRGRTRKAWPAASGETEEA